MNLKLTKQNTIVAVIIGMAIIDIIVQYVTKFIIQIIKHLC